MVCFRSQGQSVRKVWRTANSRSNAFAGVCWAGGGVWGMICSFAAKIANLNFKVQNQLNNHRSGTAVDLQLLHKVSKLGECMLKFSC